MAGKKGYKSQLLEAKYLMEQSGASEIREENVREESTRAVRRSSEQKIRETRVDRIPKEEVFHYLRSFYARDGILKCQMWQHQ